MAKQHRVTSSRSKAGRPKKATRAQVRGRRSSGTIGGSPSGLQAPVRTRLIVAEPPAPAKKPAYYEAIAEYETGVRALQRHEFSAAAGHFRTVIQRFPEERELVERATLYLRVCERETANRLTAPGTPGERIYAATVALNAGDAEGALQQLREALAMDPDNDHGHYIMAVALSERGAQDQAVSFLRQAIALNPENRSLAKHDPDLAVLRQTDAGRQLLTSPSPVVRRRPRAR
jgi:tetratricopeptide (TPR) repeat protein